MPPFSSGAIMAEKMEVSRIIQLLRDYEFKKTDNV